MGIVQAIRDLFRSPAQRAGAAGEEAIGDLLSHGRWKRRGILLRNLYVPRSDGGSSEIDLLYLTRKGLVVIESKNYTGLIRGSGRSSHWARVTQGRGDDWGRRRQEETPFYNPLWQNHSHCRVLARYLGEEVPMLSLVVFSDRCRLQLTDIQEGLVCRRREVTTLLKRWRRWRRRVLSRRELRQLAAELAPLCGAGWRERRDHVRQVRGERDRVGRCPLCGGQLVRRTVRHGPNRGRSFYGCERYPFCGYTRED